MLAASATVSAQFIRVGLHGGVTEWKAPETKEDYRQFFYRTRFAPVADVFLRRSGRGRWAMQCGLTVTVYKHHARYQIWDSPDEAQSRFYLADASVGLLRDVSLHLTEKIHPRLPRIRSFAAVSLHPGVALGSTRWTGFSGWGGGYQDYVQPSWSLLLSGGVTLEHSIALTQKMSAESCLGYRFIPTAPGAFPTRFTEHRAAWSLGLSYQL